MRYCCSFSHTFVFLGPRTAVMNGPDAANEIRELGYDVNIIGVTGNVLQEDVSHFKARGANDVIFKPVNVQELETAWKQNGVY